MKKVLIVAQKGGVYKTGIADNLAFSMEDTHTPFDFYELDAQGGSLHETTENDDAAVAIIDTPGYLVDGIEDMIADADVIIIPTRASVSDMPAFGRMRQMVQTHAPTTPTIVVVTGWNRYNNCTSYCQWLKETKRSQETLYSIPQSEIVPQSAAAGVSIIRYAPRSLPAVKMREVTNKVRELIGLQLEPELTTRQKRAKEDK